MSENEDISSSSSKSMLSKDVIAILNTGMSEGFEYDSLDLVNKKINDSMMAELCERIVKLGNKARVLYLWDNQISSIGASILFDMLKANNSSIKGIHLNDNTNIDDKCMKSVGEYIKSNKSIETILLDNTSISDAGIEILVPYLDGNTTFKTLYLNENNGITDISFPLLMKMIKSSCIEDISVNDTSIAQKSVIYTLSVCSKIKNGSTGLELSYKELNDHDLLEICDAMKKYGIDKLREINLEDNKITSRGASVLFDTLKECKSVISKLYLSHNQLDDEFMKQFGEYLQNNENVKELRLVDNKITDKGVEILSEYVIGSTTLKELNLSFHDGITDASVPYLIEMVNKSCISSINVRNTSISEEKKQEILIALSIPIEQREIPIKSNTKSAVNISESIKAEQ